MLKIKNSLQLQQDRGDFGKQKSHLDACLFHETRLLFEPDDLDLLPPSDPQRNTTVRKPQSSNLEQFVLDITEIDPRPVPSLNPLFLVLGDHTP